MLKSLCSPKRATTTPNFWDRVFQSKTSLPKEELIRDLCQHGTNEIVHHFEEVDELLLHHFPKEISCLVRVYLEWILTLQHFQDFFAHLIQSYKNFPYVSREQVERVWPGDSIPFYSVLEEWFRTYKYAKENSSVIGMNNEPHFDSSWRSSGLFISTPNHGSRILDRDGWTRKQKGHVHKQPAMFVCRKRDPLSFSLLWNGRFHSELDESIYEWIALVGIPFLETGDIIHLNKSWDWHFHDWITGLPSKKADAMQNSWDASEYLYKKFFLIQGYRNGASAQGTDRKLL